MRFRWGRRRLLSQRQWGSQLHPQRSGLEFTVRRHENPEEDWTTSASGVEASVKRENQGIIPARAALHASVFMLGIGLVGIAGSLFVWAYGLGAEEGTGVALTLLIAGTSAVTSAFWLFYMWAVRRNSSRH